MRGSPVLVMLMLKIAEVKRAVGVEHDCGISVDGARKQVIVWGEKLGAYIRADVRDGDGSDRDRYLLHCTTHRRWQ